jgi:hypothetical protein
MRYDDEDDDDDDEAYVDEAYVDVFANARENTENTTGRSLVRRELLGKEIIKQQRELLDCEARRADEAERELERVCAHADALSRRLDEVSMAFAVSRRRPGSSSSSDDEEDEGRRRRRGQSASELSAQNSRLQIENDRLKRDMEEMETRHRRELSEAKKMVASTVGGAFTAEERRTLLREIAEARKEIAVAKEARAKALSEAIDLRTKLEAEQLRSMTKGGGGGGGEETTPPKTPEWANIDWDAAYAEMDAVKASKAASRLAAETQPAQQKEEWEKIDWDAAYAEMDATRAVVSR